MTRPATIIAAGALSLALIAACPVVALADDPPVKHETVVGIAGAILTPEAQDANEDEGEKLPAALKGETKIEKLTISHDNAKKDLQTAENRVAQLQAQISELEELLPQQQARSDASIKQRYIMQSNPLAIAEPLLSSESLGEFLQHVDYLQMVSKANLEEFNKTRDMKAQLDAAKEEQARIRDEVQEKAEDVQSELKATQAARAERQAEGQEKAISQVSTEAEKAKSSKKKKSANDTEAEKETKSADNLTSDTQALEDGANWYSHRDDFIAEWSVRLDKYLAGTPLEGQGVNFAASAWKYNIDPRWSAAISNTESSKGQFCIRPHNAWGWGAADSDPYNLAAEWSSWEEAIDAHAAGLSKGYGYTISMSGAKSYCPPSWQSWYSKTLAEMAKI